MNNALPKLYRIYSKIRTISIFTINETVMLNPYFLGQKLSRPEILAFIALILIFCLFLLMLKLGFWQLSRAEEKTRILQNIETKMAQKPLDFNRLNQLVLNNYSLRKSDINLTGYKFKFQALPIQGKLIMLDNQIYQGQVGYLVFQPIMVNENSPLLLLELGFIKGLATRDSLPAIEELSGWQVFSGRIYQKQVNPLSYQLYPEFDWPKRIQNLNFQALSSIYGQPFLPVILQPNNIDNQLPKPWMPVAMSSEKHLGYAFQWFAMAITLIILTFVFIYKSQSFSASYLLFNRVRNSDEPN